MQKRWQRRKCGTHRGYICNWCWESSDRSTRETWRDHSNPGKSHWEMGKACVLCSHLKASCLWGPVPQLECLPVGGLTAQLCIGSWSLQHMVPTKRHLHFYFNIHHIRSCLYALVCGWNKMSLFLSSAAYRLKGIANGNTMSQLKHSFPPENNLRQWNWQYFSVMLEGKSRTDKKRPEICGISFLFSPNHLERCL